jgi:hypothetical protein
LQDGVDLRVIWISTAGMADMARYRIRLKNGSGETLSERRFSRLTGDVVMDDAVDPSDSAQILAFTSGTVPDSTNVPGIRADLDHNGSIDNNDQILWGSFSGNDITLISYPAFP